MGLFDREGKMTVLQLLKKYQKMQADGFETVFVTQVVNDLWQAMQHQRMLRIPKHER